jgi:hypothetical protein
MALPDVHARALLDAMDHFDTSLRESAEFAGWAEKKSQVYVIDYQGKLYPPKKVISIATQVPVNSFSGGQETNDYLSSRGFTVKRLREESLRDIFEQVLETYGEARRTESFGGFHQVRELFDSARRILEKSPQILSRPQIRVVSSYGKGRWASVPWISLLDRRETNTTQDGIYVVYLFREDGEGCYVKLGQGVAKLEKEMGAGAVAVLSANADEVRAGVGELQADGFDLSGRSDLGTTHRLAKLYEASTIASKYYPKGQIPSDSELLDDLNKLLEVYQGYVAQKGGTPKQDDRAIALVGTWRTFGTDFNKVATALATSGSWASPWSFSLKPGAAERLKPPFHLYVNGGGGRIIGRAVVSEIRSERGSEGIVSPWPDVTDDEWKGLARFDQTQSGVAKTWFRIADIQKLESFHASELEPVLGFSTPENVLNQNSFGYVYDLDEIPELESLDETPKSEPEPMAELEEHTELTRDIAWLARETLLAEPALRAMISSITGASPQILLAGPPGTSKTWVARKLAEYLTGGRRGAVRLVQFHPSYTYESFVEGIRPVARGNGVGFELAAGVVLDFVEQMGREGNLDREDRPYVIVIDEANRANLPRVLGELLFLFEYRGETIRLQYSPSFRLPQNLYFIGTMNTADRSIRAVDAALRRRFDVFELAADSQILARYSGNESEWLAKGLDSLNQSLRAALDRHHEIGHAFLMKGAVDRERLRDIWDRRIFPLVEEYLFDQPDLVRDFTLERFWPAR